MNQFTIDVIKTIQDIPSGMVMTYGQIAAFCGNPHGARQVSRILHSSTEKHNLPWYRVINSKGSISLKGEGRLIQLEMLAAEGVVFIDNRVDFEEYLFKPWKTED